MKLGRMLAALSLAASVSLVFAGREARAEEQSPTIEVIATLKLDENRSHRAILADKPFCSAVLHFPWVYVQTRSDGPTDTAKLLVFRLPNVESEDDSPDDTPATSEDDSSAGEKDAKKHGSFSETRKDDDGTITEENRVSSKEGVTHTVRSYQATVTEDGGEHVHVHSSTMQLNGPDAESIEPPPVGLFAHPMMNVPASNLSRNEIAAQPGAGEDQSDALAPIQVIEDVGDGQGLMRWDKFLVCTRAGSLEVYSIENPKNPKRLSRCEPDSRKSYSTRKIVRDGKRAFVIGDKILLCYDLSEPSKPKCLGEKVIAYDGIAGCIAAGCLYVGGSKKTDAASSTGIAVFDIANPADPKEVYFLPLKNHVYQLFALPGNQLLASLDADSPSPVASLGDTAVRGNSAFINLKKPKQPVLDKELKQSGGRSSTLLSTKQGNYFICDGIVFLIHGQRLRQMYPFDTSGSMLDVFPYHGDSDGDYATLPLDHAAIVVRIRHK